MQRHPWTDEHLSELAQVLRLTRPEELACDEWLDQIGGYGEALAAGQGPPPGSELITHHLEICPECREEFEALVQALRGVPA